MKTLAGCRSGQIVARGRYLTATGMCAPMMAKYSLELLLCRERKHKRLGEDRFFSGAFVVFSAKILFFV